MEVLRAVVGVGEPARLELVEQARERASHLVVDREQGRIRGEQLLGESDRLVFIPAPSRG